VARASKLRRALAVYIDFVIFSAAWGLVIWGVSLVLPALQGLHPGVKLAGFLLVELLLLERVSGRCSSGCMPP
jgi:hypothetical protein